MSSHALVFSLAIQFLNAALDRARWMPALQALADATHSSHGELIGIGEQSAIAFDLHTDPAPGAMEDFIAIQGGSPGINPRVAMSRYERVLQTQYEAHYEAVRPSMVSDVYEDFVRQYDLQFGCQTKIREEAGNLIGLAVVRGVRDGPTTEEQRSLFSAVAPYVRTAVDIGIALEDEGHKLVLGTFEAMRSAAFVCDARGRVRAFTPAAEALLAKGKLRLNGGILSSPNPVETDLLGQAVHSRCDLAAPLAGASTVVLRGPPGEIPLVLDVTPLPRREWSLRFVPHVLVTARLPKKDGPPNLLRSTFGLSPAEAEIAVEIAAGRSRASIAQSRGVTIGTVRAQLKSVFGKLGINREIELVARLAPFLHG